MKKIIAVAVSVFAITVSYAQERYFTKNGKVTFYSKTPMENIEARNSNAVSVLDKNTGQLEFSALARGFEFEKALMQEHFNENYIESDKFPKAVFKGKLSDVSKVDFAKDGKYNISVAGTLTIHGVTKDITAPGTITIEGTNILASANFSLVPEDFNISIPAIVREKIESNLRVEVLAKYQPMQ